MAEVTQRAEPKTLTVSTQLKTVCAVLMFLGAGAFVVMLLRDSQRAWYDYVTAYYFFLVLSVGGLFFTALQHATQAGWSVNIRRLCESFTAFLPIALVGGFALLLSGHHLFDWMDHAKAVSDPLIRNKYKYLNTPFFIVRLVIYFGVWLFFAKKIVGFSTQQDKTGDDSLTLRAGPWSIAFLLLFALTFTFVSVDLMMSLQPHWFSTIFGIYCFGGLFQATIAALILLVIYCRRKGLLTGYVDENHLHDLGKFLFAFTIFWAYIAYSQYMLIWYANLPAETSFFLPRVVGPWMWVSVSLIVFKFIVPFFALVSRWSKRNEANLIAVSILVLVMEYVDIYWLAFPTLNSKELIFSIPEILIFGGFAGAFVLSVTRFLSQHPVVPFRDPRIQESIHHHVIY